MTPQHREQEHAFRASGRDRCPLCFRIGLKLCGMPRAAWLECLNCRSYSAYCTSWNEAINSGWHTLLADADPKCDQCMHPYHDGVHTCRRLAPPG